MRRGMESISLWHCSGVMKPRLLIAVIMHCWVWCLSSSSWQYSIWIRFTRQYSQACGHPCYLCTFPYPISSFQSTLHLICFDTALINSPPLSVMPLCDLLSLWRVSMIVFWTIAKSAVFPIIVLSKNKRYPRFICMDGHLLKLKYKYSNILRYYFWLSLAVSANHQNWALWARLDIFT